MLQSVVAAGATVTDAVRRFLAHRMTRLIVDGDSTQVGRIDRPERTAPIHAGRVV